MRQPHQLLLEFAHPSVVARLCLARLSHSPPPPADFSSAHGTLSVVHAAPTSGVAAPRHDGSWCAWQHLLTTTPRKSELLCTLLNDVDACYLPSLALVRFLLHEGLPPSDLLRVDMRRITNMDAGEFETEIGAMSDLKVHLCVAAPHAQLLPEPVLALVHGYLPWFDNLSLSTTHSLEVQVHRLCRRVAFLERENAHVRVRLAHLERAA
jgi:hypothetical protein